MPKDTLTQSEGKARGLILSLWTPALLIAVLLVGAFVACGGDSSSGANEDRDTSRSEADRETGGNGDRPQPPRNSRRIRAEPSPPATSFSGPALARGHCRGQPPILLRLPYSAARSWATPPRRTGIV